ncbi:MAG: DUF2141 domain-containing protein [Clostridia bacterium]|nr:DUF2141 domain-containing protein [Deltaproteobacteria bacterium]
MPCANVLFVLLMLGLPLGAAADAEEFSTGIVMHVDGLKTDQGTLHCALYANAKGFPTEPEHAATEVKVQVREKRATCVFPDVKAGRYAVALWHDVNGDNKLDANWLGIPKEPVGSSNNAKGSFGPPSFAKASFDFQPPLVRQTIRLE